LHFFLCNKIKEEGDILILNNFKKLISLVLSNGLDPNRYTNYTDLNGYETHPFDFPLFKNWQGQKVSFLDGRTDFYIPRRGNFFQSTFCGLANANTYNTSLPNNISSEEDFLANLQFFYNGQIHATRRHNNRPDGYFTNNTDSAGIGPYMVLGSGDTPPTPDDYKLDSFIPTTELSVQGFSCGGPVNQNPIEYFGTFTYAYKNETNSNITVKEVGLAKTIESNGVPSHLLLIREVLQNPVVIKPEEITTFTIVIK
jgi:hypothetical protein